MRDSKGLPGKVLVGLVGAGIQRSAAPALHEGEASRQGLRLHYQLIDFADPAALPTVIGAARLMGFAGLNVTFPYKQAVIPLLDALAPPARAIGAVNTVVREGGRLIGHNTDGEGWAWGLRRALPGASLERVVLLGAGGAGSACADALLRLGAERLAIVDREPARATALAARLNTHHAGERAQAARDLGAALRGASGLVHATPTGMDDHPGLPLPAALLVPGLWVSEVVYVPLETALLAAARRAGCALMDGGHMNIGQAAASFRLFTGRDADPELMAAHFRRLAGTRRAPD